jgi:hypothetical protein
MFVQQLSTKDQLLIRECLLAICNGPFLEDFEFHSRIAVERDVLKKIISYWPNIDDSDDASDVALGINNSLNELCYGVSISAEDWNRWITAPRTEIERVYQDWSRLRCRNKTGIR